MQKEKVKKGEIVIGKPIPWNAFDENGMLLLRKGQIVQSESQLDILIARGLYHIKLNNGDDSEKNVIKVAQSPFELIESVEKIDINEAYREPKIQELLPKER